MHDRLVVGFDGSERSAAAIRWASVEAEKRGASVHVVSSYSMPPVIDYYGVGTGASSPSEMQEVKDACSVGLAAAVAECVERHPSVGFDFQAVDEPAARVLVREAGDADLLVVGSTGAGAVARFLLGSVTGALLHASPCPVVVVPAVAGEPSGRIVVGADGSAQSDVAVRWAGDEADRLGTELSVVHAWEYPYRLTDNSSARGSDIAEVDAAIVMERATAVARDRNACAVVGELVEGGAVQALLDAGETADLIVVGSRGRGGFRSMLLGSVAHAVAAHAVCPVVVVR